MPLEQAKAIVAKTNPNAVWVVTSTFKGEPDTFDILDFTYSDEVRAKIFEFDCVTDALYAIEPTAEFGVVEVTV